MNVVELDVPVPSDIKAIPPPVPNSYPFALELTFNTWPAVPIANLWSALAPLKTKSPCVVVGDTACPFATYAQFACAVPPEDGLFPVVAVVQI